MAVEATTAQEAGERIEVGTEASMLEIVSDLQMNAQTTNAVMTRALSETPRAGSRSGLNGNGRSHRDHWRSEKLLRALICNLGCGRSDRRFATDKNDTGEQSCELGGISNDGDRDRDVAEHRNRTSDACGGQKTHHEI